MNEGTPASFVVVFFLNGQGEMCSRVTDVGAHETWIVSPAQALWRLIVGRPTQTTVNRPTQTIGTIEEDLL